MSGRIAYYGNIVKDGLVLDLDAAIMGSYPKTGSTWFDISNNGNNGWPIYLYNTNNFVQETKSIIYNYLPSEIAAKGIVPGTIIYGIGYLPHLPR